MNLVPASTTCFSARRILFQSFHLSGSRRESRSMQPEGRLPPRYFLEPIGGVLSLCPLALIAILTPLCRKPFGGRRGIFAFVSTILVFAVGCILFLAAIGLTSQRFEVDFEPFARVRRLRGCSCRTPRTSEKWTRALPP